MPVFILVYRKLLRTGNLLSARSRLINTLSMAMLLSIAGCSSKEANKSVNAIGSRHESVANTSSTGQPKASRPELTNVYQVGPDVDLLSLIDPQRDAVSGDFRLDDGTLVFSGSQATYLNFEVDLPEQYELLMAVARTQGNESLNLGIHVGGATTMIVIEGWRRGINGINKVDGRIAENNVTSNTFPVFDDHSPKFD
jgi:hypothetical protein